MKTFKELGLSPQLQQAISDMGFEEMTPIQQEAIPVGLSGKDIIGQARTGTGKTAAFGIPMVERFEAEQNLPQGLVIAPTRELAVQVAEELNKIGQVKGVRALPVYGGQDIDRQIKGLKKRPSIIVGTPGRLLDHIRRRTVRLQGITAVVLDEADEMLNMGFIEDIEAILEEVPTDRQTLLFSATMPKPIQDLAMKFMSDPQMIQVKSKEVTVPAVHQTFIEVQERKKFDALCLLLDIQPPELAIVFARTKRRVDEIAEGLKSRGYSAEGIHGDLTQARRESVLRQFKSSSIDVLVATDVAARGLDISGVSHVYNFDVPLDAESYVHRIGRTGRAGRSGEAVTLVTPREQDHFRYIQRATGAKIQRQPLPAFADVIRGQQQMAGEKMIEAIGSGNIGEYRDFATQLLEENDSVNLVAAALKLLTREPDTTPVRITEEGSYRFRQGRSSKPGWGGKGGSGKRRPHGGGGGGGYNKKRHPGGGGKKYR